MPKRRASGIFGPLKSKPAARLKAEDVAAKILADRRDVQRRALEIAASSRLAPFPTSSELTADHPYSRQFGLEKARRLIDPTLTARLILAAERRETIRANLIAGVSLEQIAIITGLRPNYLVKVRASLRREGKLA